MKIVIKDVETFKKLLLREGFTQRGFGRSIKISAAHAYQIVNGKANPSPETAKRITEALKVGFDDIFFIQSACKSDQVNTA